MDGGAEPKAFSPRFCPDSGKTGRRTVWFHPFRAYVFPPREAGIFSRNFFKTMIDLFDLLC